MTPAVEVVGERKRVPPAKIALNGKVSLLRVRVNEILGLRISEWLEAQRQESRLRRVRQVEIQVILVQENRLREVQRLELLLVRQVAQVGVGKRERRGSAAWLIQRPLKDRDRVQIPRVTVGATAWGSATESQLAARRTVRRIAQEVEPEQRVVVEQPVRSTDDGLAVAFGIIRKSETRLDIVLVGLNSFL